MPLHVESSRIKLAGWINDNNQNKGRELKLMGNNILYEEADGTLCSRAHGL